VSLHLPVTPATRGLLDARRLGLLKPSAWLINTARGALVDEGCLADALRSRRLGGAALDVRQNEPPGPDDPIRNLPNVILTPHCAYYSRQSIREVQQSAARNVVAVLQGDSPVSPVNPGLIPRSAR
jgi:D-3-phosphoglycerate dehydrogenase